MSLFQKLAEKELSLESQVFLDFVTFQKASII